MLHSLFGVPTANETTRQRSLDHAVALRQEIGHESTFVGFGRLPTNKFTAWRVFKMGSESERRQMKVCVHYIDSSPCEARVNLGFKSSLFFRTWSLGCFLCH